MKSLFSDSIKKIKQGPIQLQLNFIIGTLILLTIISIASVAYIRSINLLHETFRDSQVTILTETREKINSKLRVLEKTMQMMSTDYRIQNYLDTNESVTDRDVYKYFNDCINLNKYKVEKNGITYVRDLIDDIIFINPKRNFVSRRASINIEFVDQLRKKEVFQRAFQEKGKLVWSDVFYNDLSEDYVKSSFLKEPKLLLNQFMLVRYVVNEKYKSDVGYLAISVNLDRLMGLVENIRFGQEGEVFLVDCRGRILASKNKEMILETMEFDKRSFKKIFNTLNSGYIEGTIWGKTYYISYAPLDINNWRVIGIVPKKVFQAQANKIRFTILGIGALSFFIILYFGTKISRGITSPLEKIVYSMDRIEKSGDLASCIHQEGPQEIVRLGNSFNNMVKRIQALTQRIYNEQKMKREAELKAMQLQINPHFLYNSLDSIKWMVISSDENREKVVDMIDCLSRFFKIGLSGGKEKIPIADELDHVRSYLTVQKIRYNNRLNFIIDVEKGIENYMTIKLILQPLVENSIYHGINKKEGKGFIKITGVKVDEQTIRFEIIDNGVGMTEEEVKALNDRLKSTEGMGESLKPGNKGFGVLNVNGRIKLNFGNRYGLHYVSKKGIGTKVEVTIPVIYY